MRRGEQGANTRRTRDERGEGATGYMSALLLIALIAAVVVSANFGGSLVDGIKYAICRVFSAAGLADCETPADRALRPSCLTNLETGSYGGNIEVLIIRVGKDYSFLRTTSIAPDGTKTVTVIGVKGKTGGVGTGIGAGINIGNVINLGADALAEAKVRLGTGDGWQFTGPDAEKKADDLMGQLQEQFGIDAVKENGGFLGQIGGTIYDAVAGPDLPEPNIRRYEGEFDLYAGVWAMAGVGPKDPKGRHRKPDRHTDPRGPQEPDPKDSRGTDSINPNAAAWAAVDGNERAILEINERTGDTSVTMMLRGEANYGANWGANGPQGRHAATGAITLTRDKNGKLSKVTFAQTHIVNGTATVVTTTLPLETDADRLAVASGLLDPREGGPSGQLLSLTWDDMAPTRDPGPDASPLQRLLYEKGTTSKVDYEYDQTDALYGASVKLGLRLGVNAAISDSTRRATGAQYLGAPTPAGTRPYLDQPECRG
ncbi:hypothetical protein [Spirillospora sp. NPDC029432]|uniref:hypothetical protein n=1 Tax=Spirillospora sp. NPDC029432 TaxID=3154599 RepID=UPI0034550765